MSNLPQRSQSTDPIRLEVFKHLFAAVAEEMGEILRKSSYSPNIKERRDYSCALFDPRGQMVAQAAHIPVHLGSMPLSVTAALEKFSGESPAPALQPGDVIFLNDPFQGGTHLPDVTMISPVFFPESLDLLGFVANRAHHADVGGASAGSMGLSREIYQEGVTIPPLKLVAEGQLNQGVWDLILANVRTPGERAGDLRAQLAANRRGVQRLQEMAGRYGSEQIGHFMEALLGYSERLMQALLADLPAGETKFTDYLEWEVDLLPITVTVTTSGELVRVDFTGSAPQQPASINAVYAITLSAVFYAFRCLLSEDVPNNSGCMRPIEVIAPLGSVVNARHPAAVAGGNVETSQRIVDVVFGALAALVPDRIPAASQGTMNNLTIGGWDPIRRRPFAYYETIGGGAGALPGKPGSAAVHSHMTNTLNTPVEALEFAYPLRVSRYEIRRGSGGAGQAPGGAGICRDIELLADAQVTLLTERRALGPYGLAGGGAGRKGKNNVLRDGVETPLPIKGSRDLKAGDVVQISTPGGGGYGKL